MSADSSDRVSKPRPTIVSDEESPIIVECLNIFRMPCLCANPGPPQARPLSRINHDNEVEEGMHISLSFIYMCPRVLRGILFILSIGQRRRESRSLRRNIKSLMSKEKK